MPFLLQIPGISPEWAARESIRRLDDRLEFEDAWIGNVPSMIAMNGNPQPATGDPSTDPSQQGGKGAANAPRSTGAQPPAPPPQFAPPPQ
jgi:hypothetical protein